MGLRIIADAHIMANVDLPAGRLELSNDRAQKSRLARAIRPKQPDTITTQKLQVGNTHQHLRLLQSTPRIRGGVSHHEFLSRKHHLTAIHNGAELEMHLWKILGSLDTVKAVKQFLAPARFTTALACLVTTNKLLCVSDMRLLRLVFAHPALHALLS